MRKYYLKVFNIYFLKNLEFTLFVVSNVARKSRFFFGEKIYVSEGGGEEISVFDQNIDPSVPCHVTLSSIVTVHRKQFLKRF